MTVFNVQLQSVKKIGDADVVVGIAGAEEGGGPLSVEKRQDPNKTHPLRQTEVVETIGTLHGNTFTSYTFQAIAWKHNLKENSQYCWKATEGVLTRYSNDVVTYIKRLSPKDLEAALADYREHLRKRAKTKKNG